MAKRKKSEKEIEQYEHKDKERANIPPVGLVTPASDPDTGDKISYEYDPHLVVDNGGWTMGVGPR
ncbi:MAG: hypothetical protein U9R17_17550 [Thermodesulfobacteriota bacterium]|nr:hypothetical protein [Thermodesulfobacteriota bacterium]